MIYLDNNATTRPTSEVVEAMLDTFHVRWHNPSSIHRAGQGVRQRIELARMSVSRLIGASMHEVIFTSGGTESIDLAVRGLLAARRRTAGPGQTPVIVSTHVEHSAIRYLVRSLAEDGCIEARYAPLDADGVIDPDALEALLDERVAMVVAQWSNNETGAIQPVERIGAACRARRVPFVCDGTQWVGKMPTNVRETPVDLLIFSAHKFHGPKGAGALYVRRGMGVRPVLHGSQESERRGGTENTAGIIGMGVACDAASKWLADASNRERIASLRDRFEAGVLARVPEARINGPTAPGARMWNTSNIGFPRLEAEALLMLLSEKGLCASAGAACSSGSLEPSPVLIAMGIPAEYAHGSVRFSLSRETTDEEIDQAIEIVAASVERLRSSSAALA